MVKLPYLRLVWYSIEHSRYRFRMKCKSNTKTEPDNFILKCLVTTKSNCWRDIGQLAPKTFNNYLDPFFTSTAFIKQEMRPVLRMRIAPVGCLFPDPPPHEKINKFHIIDIPLG